MNTFGLAACLPVILARHMVVLAKVHGEAVRYASQRDGWRPCPVTTEDVFAVIRDELSEGV